MPPGICEITFEFAAEEKYGTPAPTTSLTAFEIGPSWYIGSSKKVTSSTITLEPAARRARMLSAIASALVPEVANASPAPGARSWTSWAIARPSSLPSGRSASTSTAVPRPHGLPGPGRSPERTSWAAWVAAPEEVSKESETTPTLVPRPSMSKPARASPARICASASETTEPVQVFSSGCRGPPRPAPAEPTIGSIASVTASTPATPASARRSAGATARSTVR